MPLSPLAPVSPPSWSGEQSACKASETLWSGLTLQEGACLWSRSHGGHPSQPCRAAPWSDRPAFRAVTSRSGTTPQYCLERRLLRFRTPCERVTMVTMMKMMVTTADGSSPGQGHGLRSHHLLVDRVWWRPKPSVLGPVQPRDNVRNLSDDRKTNKRTAAP